MRVAIGSDHAGFELKRAVISYLETLKHEVKDLGTDTAGRSCDYPDLATEVCREVLESGCLGILICGTGIGMSMAANKVRGIRAALCTSEFQGRLARQHNDANVLCLGGRVTGQGIALAIVKEFLEAEFEGGRHLIRVRKFDF